MNRLTEKAPKVMADATGTKYLIDWNKIEANPITDEDIIDTFINYIGHLEDVLQIISNHYDELCLINIGEKNKKEFIGIDKKHMKKEELSVLKEYFR